MVRDNKLRKFLLAIGLILAVSLFFGVASPVFAQSALGPFEGLGPLGEIVRSISSDNPSAASALFVKVLSNAVGVMTIVAFIWFLFQLFIGAIGWLSSEGEKAKLQEAQKKITNAIIGLIIVIAAIFLIKIIGTIFDIDMLDIQGLLNQIWK